MHKSSRKRKTILLEIEVELAILCNDRARRIDGMSTSAYFPESFLLLQQEGYLIRSCLATGLTQLSKAHVHNKGEFYSALFNLSIGTERLMKAIMIIHHMLNNGLAVPTRVKLKGYGHDIKTLYSKCVVISSSEKTHVPAISTLDSITQEFIELLNEFAQSTRYHNLDALSSSASGKDPLLHINEILSMVIDGDIPASSARRISELRKRLASDIDDCFMLIAQGLDGSDLTLEQGLVLPALHEKAVHYIIVRLIQLLAPIKGLIECLSEKAYKLSLSQSPFPQMHEFVDFLGVDRKYALRKKRWP